MSHTACLEQAVMALSKAVRLLVEVSATAPQNVSNRARTIAACRHLAAAEDTLKEEGGVPYDA